ncbi:MAG: non-heme iron oxygenase ferredoxin subunit [Ilumatobacteraceae bacterium]
MSDMTAVGSVDEFLPGTATRVTVNGIPVAVVRIGDDFYAIGDICSHANVSLSGGEVWCEERQLECPKHGSAFSLVTGEPDTLPATQSVAVYTVTVGNGQVSIGLNGSTT